MAELRILFLNVVGDNHRHAEQTLEQWVNAGWRIVGQSMDANNSTRVVCIYTMQKD